MKLHPVAQAVLGGLTAALVVATPIVDDGLLPSEILSIVGAFLAGTGLTAVTPSRSLVRRSKGKHRADTDGRTWA